MTDEMISEVCDSLLFMRSATDLFRGAVVRHIEQHDGKPLYRNGYLFKIVPHEKRLSPSERRKFRANGCRGGRDLRIERARGAA